GPAEHDDDGLCACCARMLDRVHHQVERDLLLIEQRELLPFANLFCCDTEQLFGRPVAEIEEFVRGSVRVVPACVDAEQRTQTVQHACLVVHGEQRAELCRLVIHQ